MSVYYVHSPELELIKIGFADNPHNRLSSLRCHSPARLVMLAAEDGGRKLEQQRHADFQHLHVRGEWFRYAGALRAFVEALPPYVAPKGKQLPGPLGAWIKSHGMGLESFAALMGTSAATVSRICSGKMSPVAHIHRIYEVTNGEIDANALFGLPPMQPPDEAAAPAAATG